MPSTQDIVSMFEADCDVEVARAFASVAADYMAQTRSRDGRVSTIHTPAGLSVRFDEPIPRGTQSVDTIIRRLRSEVIPDCNHLYHPRYIGHQVSAPMPIGVWMESVTAALNQSAAVFEMSPVGTVLEHRLIAWMCELAGFGSDRGAGGTLTTGGTEATFTALLAARSVVIPDVWSNGLGSELPVLLCGEHAHYAVTRAAGELGIGLRNVLAVRSRDFKLDPDALRAALESLAAQHKRVMGVVATAGSTATGSFHDLEAIALLRDEHRVCPHVDGAHGAAATRSPKHHGRVRRLERQPSVAFDPDKMMLLPLEPELLLVRH